MGLRLHLVLPPRSSRAAWHELHARRLTVQMAGLMTRLLRLSCVLVTHAMRMVTTMYCAVTLCQMLIVSALGLLAPVNVKRQRRANGLRAQLQVAKVLLVLSKHPHARLAMETVLSRCTLTVLVHGLPVRVRVRRQARGSGMR